MLLFLSFNLAMTVTVSTTFNDLPHDIVFNVIVPNIFMKDAFKLSCVSKKYDENIEQMLELIIKNDHFFQKYMKNRSYDFIDVLNNSSFSHECFFKMYDNINYDCQPKFIMEFHDLLQNQDLFHIERETIDNTFELFKILMNLTMFRLKFQFRNLITNSLIEYCSHIYKAKYPKRKDIAYDKFSILILKRDDILWFSSNINLYDIYENYNLFNVARRSFDLKNNLEQDICNFNLNVFKNDKTIEFIMSLYQYIDNCEFQIYLIHTILSYLFTVFSSDKINDSCYKIILEKDTFQTVIKYKAIYLHQVIDEFSDLIPYNIRKIMLQNAASLYNIIEK